MTLAEALAGVNDPRSRYGAGAPSGATSNLSGMLDPSIEEQIRLASQPEPYTPEPIPKESKLWQRLLTSLGDAGTAYAAGRGAGTATNFTGKLLARDQQGRDAASRNKYGEIKSKREGERKGAELRLTAIMRKQMADDEARGRKEIADANLAEKKWQVEQRVAGEQANRDLQVKIQEMKAASDLEQEKSRGEFQKAVARISAGQDKAAVRQSKKDLGEAIGFIGQTAAAAQKMLDDGTQTPESIEATVRRTLDSLVLEDDARKAAEAYATKELGPILRKHRIAKQIQQSGGGDTTGASTGSPMAIPMDSPLALGH